MREIWQPLEENTPPEINYGSSCLRKLMLTVLLSLALVVLFGAGLASSNWLPSGWLPIYTTSGTGCQVSNRFSDQIRRWCGLITAQAQNSGLPADLVAALILQESGGNPSARSPSGAIGLMQIMPSDGRAARFTCHGAPCFSDRPTAAELEDPAFNIRYGTSLLQMLLESNGGNLREALKAYGPYDAGYSYADTVLSLYHALRNP